MVLLLVRLVSAAGGVGRRQLSRTGGEVNKMLTHTIFGLKKSRLHFCKLFCEIKNW